MMIFLMICNLLIPGTMIVFGALWQVKPPRDIDSAVGYRSTRSMRSQEAWDYTHKVFGRVWLIIGILLLAVTVPLVVLVEEAAYYIVVAQLAVMVAPIVGFELHLMHKFGK